MTTLKEEIRLVSRKGEDGYTFRGSEYTDLKRHVESMEPNESSFWSGLQWSLAGGSLSAFIATGGYHLFEATPSGHALLVGYLVGAFLFAMTLLLGIREQGNTPSFSHHKEEALILLTRVATEKWRDDTPESNPMEDKDSDDTFSTVDANLFTDLRNMKDKLGEDR